MNRFYRSNNPEFIGTRELSKHGAQEQQCDLYHGDHSFKNHHINDHHYFSVLTVGKDFAYW